MCDLGFPCVSRAVTETGVAGYGHLEKSELIYQDNEAL